MKKKISGLNIFISIVDIYIIFYFATIFMGIENIILERGYSLIYPVFVVWNVLAAVILSIISLGCLSKLFRIELLKQKNIKEGVLKKITLYGIMNKVINILLIISALSIGKMFVAQITLFIMIVPSFYIYVLKQDLKEQELAEIKKHEDDLNKEFDNLFKKDV